MIDPEKELRFIYITEFGITAVLIALLLLQIIPLAVYIALCLFNWVAAFIIIRNGVSA